MHAEVIKYCESVKQRFPEYFTNKAVLDCGSLDINGNNRYLFEKCSYTGIDICKGKNVDVVTPVQLYKANGNFDMVISTEMLEHDRYYNLSLVKMYLLTNHKGLLLFTAAGTGRAEHGTTEHLPDDSPKTLDYYCNVTAQMIAEALPLDLFSWFEISYTNTDIRFAGIKR